jgi:hypothetical protein
MKTEGKKCLRDKMEARTEREQVEWEKERNEANE